MGNIFNMDNGFFSMLSKITDLLFLSVIWILLCIPIITIGPATTALYYATVKVIRRERGYLFREFFRSFRTNFKKGTITGVILSIITFLIAYDLYYAWVMLAEDYKKGSIMLGIFIALAFLVLCFSIYVYPILSRFEMNMKQLLKAASFMSMRHLPSTIAMAAIVLVGIVILIFVPAMIFFIPGIVALSISFVMERVLKRYMPETEGPGEETGRDEWYLE